MSNYRPISILPLYSKIVERIVAERLLRYIDKFSILDTSQYGFQKGKCTEDALVKFSEYVYSNLDNKNHAFSIFVDFSKAFDIVQHEILLDKLYVYGIRGVCSAWFRSYLENRVHSVRIGNCMSNYKVSNISVPQGSVLGPLQYLFYVNDTKNSLHNSSDVILFADGTTILLQGKNHNREKLLFKFSQTNNNC